MTSNGYLPEQVFWKTGLFWKRMPKKTFIIKEETKMPGQKPMKGRLTLLFCANASGDLKVMPLLLYHSENPCAFKKHKDLKLWLSWLPRGQKYDMGSVVSDLHQRPLNEWYWWECIKEAGWPPGGKGISL
ncbi:hypothetical protein JRQ81_000586 [Phrynocephalus forsythii]|uniref:DDE-1 domain-containing protein n=1 Tax=Phrynocephalus forsythii TaxID=171643 RepID=A0A9Q0Y7X2_9SAUR|nr:hypothetical protein JRQ81_000586 [Phrynocephalus forsythii]